MRTMQQLGRYEIVAELGRGAMGAVFRARDPRIDRIVAIKTISVPSYDSSSMDNDEYRQRFFREAQAAGRLSHPGIVAIFDVGEDETSRSPFLVMEFVDGRTLDQLVTACPNSRIPIEDALDLIQQIAMALDYAQSQSIVHRDIKPANIIVTRERRAKIADFGIAKTSFAEITLPGHVLGTPAYMSPEQLNGQPVDGRSDLFSLGVIAYWLLTGEKPFTGATITEVSIQVATKEPKAPTSVDPALSPDLDYVLARALAKDPAQRYQRGKQLADDLDDIRAGVAPRSLSAEHTSVLTAASTDKTVPIAPGSAASATAVRRAAARATPDSTPRRSGRGAFLIYSLIGAVAMLAVVLTLAARFSPALPASLQIVGRYPFQSAEVFIWVDGDLRYHDELHPSVTHGKSHATSGGSIAITLPVRAGTHTVRVHVDAAGDKYDRDVSIPGRFRAYSEKTLLLDFQGSNLDLRWQ